MVTLERTQEKDARVQNRFLRWLQSTRRDEPPEELILHEELWRATEVSISNPGAVKEPNLRTVTLKMESEPLDPSKYPEGRKQGIQKFFLRFSAMQPEVSVLTNLSGRKIRTFQMRQRSIFEQETVLQEIDSLLEENSLLQRQVDELQAAIQSMISGRPELPSPTFRDRMRENPI